MTDVASNLAVVTHDAPPPSNGHRPPAGGGRQSPPEFALTDPGNAARMIYHWGTELCYCKKWGQWTIWDGKRHALDEIERIMVFATDTAERMIEEVGREENEARRSLLAKHAHASQSIARLKAMVEIVRSRPEIAVTPEVFDADPWALNVENGTLDLRTGQLRPHCRADHITKLAPVHYDPAAEAPLWDAFLNRVLDGNQPLVSFLKRAAGYTLTGITWEQRLFFLYGTGRNGKSTFLNVLKHILGEYSRTTPPETLMVKREGHIPNDVAALLGARFVPTTEIEDGARMAEGLVKQITGGDVMSARFMRGEYFDFKPTFKIWLAGNHKPVIRGTDIAIWQRIHLVPFTVAIPIPEQDPQLLDRLLAEAPGILRWLVEGCLEWQAGGLRPPAEVESATEDYRAEMDVLARFLEDCCVESYRAICIAKALYEAYEQWCKDTGERQWSQQLLGRKLRERGHVPERNGQTRVWQGIGLRQTE